MHLKPYDAFDSTGQNVGTAYGYAAVPKGVWDTYNVYQAQYPRPPPPPPPDKMCCEVYPLGVCAE